MTKKLTPAAKAYRVGSVHLYHGRDVEIVEAPREVRTPTGARVAILRVRDPRRGLRGMFLANFEAGLGEKPEKVFRPDEDEASFGGSVRA